MQMKLRFNCFFLLVIFLFNQSFSSQVLSGTVKDGAGAGVEGATVQLVIANKTTTTDANGNWQFDLPSSIKMRRVQNGSFSAAIRNGLLAVTIHEPQLHVKVSLYQLDGTLINYVIDKKLPSGHHTINLLKQSLPPKIVLIKADIGGTVSYFKLPAMTGTAGHIGPVSIW
ncbi:MAG: carboxypeptidase regulatory-like domain-containing protein, partial [Fibrobacter sp.]|nr:carboxypeptidase regulatory-like domain-containing protein [Fibrobacter sp.]